MSLCSNWYLGISPQIFQAWLLMEKETLVYITCSHQYWKQRHSSQSEATYFGEDIIQAILLLSEWSKLKYTSVLRAGTISSRPPSGYQLLCLRCWADAAFGAKKEPAELADPPYPSTQGKELGLQIWASLQNSDFQPFADPKPHELLNWAGERWLVWTPGFSPHILTSIPNSLSLTLSAYAPLLSKYPRGCRTRRDISDLPRWGPFTPRATANHLYPALLLPCTYWSLHSWIYLGQISSADGKSQREINSFPLW